MTQVEGQYLLWLFNGSSIWFFELIDHKNNITNLLISIGIINFNTKVPQVKQTRSPEYQRLYTDFLSEGIIFAYQQPHHRINKNPCSGVMILKVLEDYSLVIISIYLSDPCFSMDTKKRNFVFSLYGHAPSRAPPQGSWN